MPDPIQQADDAAEWALLGLVTLASGEELTLWRKGTEYSVSVNDLVLMNSRSHYSEEQLAILGCAHLTGQPAPQAPAKTAGQNPTQSSARVLVGGLGMGFTLRAALDALPAHAVVDVAELLPEIVMWNREQMGHLAGHPLADPRARVVIGDVQDTLAAASNCYDAILLDVDNGPVAFTASTNEGLYADAGLQLIANAMHASGVLALWSTNDDGAFTRRLRDNGYHVRKKRVPAREKGCSMHLLWIATKT
jgi:S-adenosyl-L-methionine-dependent methyltransferase